MKSKTPGESCVSHRAASLASFLQTAVQAFMRRQVHTSLLFLHFLRESPPESLIRFIKGGFVRLKDDASEWGPMSAMPRQLPALERAMERGGEVRKATRRVPAFVGTRGKRFDVGCRRGVSSMAAW